MRYVAIVLLVGSLSVGANCEAGERELDGPSVGVRSAPAEVGIAEVRRGFVELASELLGLEEDQRYPPESRLLVFISMGSEADASIESVLLDLNGHEVLRYQLTAGQLNALALGGVHQLYLGNVSLGSNNLSATFIGRDARGRDYRQTVDVPFEKHQRPCYVELQISKVSRKRPPEIKTNVSS